MRLIISIILILAAIIGAGYWNNLALQSSTNDLTEQIDRVTSTIKKGDWPGAVEQSSQLEKVWKEEAGWWPMVLDHQEMDNIEFSMARIKEYVASQNTALSLGHLNELKLMIEHIPKKEAVKLENIL
jgi:hypothetical protein